MRYFQQYANNKEHRGRNRGIQPLLLHLLSISNDVHLVLPKLYKTEFKFNRY